MTDRVTVFVPGTVYWAKIVGDGALHDNYERTGREWSYELVPDDTSFLKENRLLDRLKEPRDEKNPEKGEYLVLRKPEFNRDGEKNEPIRIYTNENEPWDDRLIGNGSRVVAKLSVVDWGKGKKKSIYTQAIRVEELVPYVSSEFGAYDGSSAEATPKKSRSAKAPEKAPEFELDDLDDEVPF